jgi:ABC-type Zn uptake system ZnuABC Zn-binding protein ZnuA
MALAGCGRPPTPASTPHVGVCATVYPLAAVAREVGGELVRPDWILDLGDPLSGFSASSAERQRLRSVDFVVCDGLRTEGWAAQDIASMKQTGRVIALETLGAARTAPATGYLWLDPMVIRDLIPRLADDLAHKLPRYRDDLRQRSDKLVADLDAVVARHPKQSFEGARVMTVSTQFDALLSRCGITATNIEANPLRLTDNEIYRLRTRSKEEGLLALLLPFDTPPGTVADIEARTDMRVILIDHLGLANLPGHQSITEIVDYNLTQLQTAAGLVREKK